MGGTCLYPQHACYVTPPPGPYCQYTVIVELFNNGELKGYANADYELTVCREQKKDFCKKCSRYRGGKIADRGTNGPRNLPDLKKE